MTRCDLASGDADLFNQEAVCGGMLYHEGKGAEETRRCSKCGAIWSMDKYEEYPT